MRKEVFRAGTHRDSKGNTRDWTIPDLDNIVLKFNAKKKRGEDVPIVVGHPTTNAPAYGWVSTLTRDGEGIFADFEQVDPEFEELVKEGRYKNTSISLDDDLTIRHIGFLGAQAPAVKGLKQVEFSQADKSITIEFADDKTQEKTPTKEPEKEQKKETKSIEISDLLKEIRTALSPELASKVEAIINRALNKNFSDVKDTAMEKRLEFLEKQNRELQFETYFKDKVMKGDLIPAQKKSFRVIYDDIVNTMEFAEQDSKFKAMDEFIGQFPKRDLTKEFAESSDHSEDKGVLDTIKSHVKFMIGG